MLANWFTADQQPSRRFLAPSDREIDRLLGELLGGERASGLDRQRYHLDRDRARRQLPLPGSAKLLNPVDLDCSQLPVKGINLAEAIRGAEFPLLPLK